MQIDVRRFFEGDNQKEEIEFFLDLSDTEIWGHAPVSAPVKITGCVQNKSSIVTLAYKAVVDIHTFCDRCLTEFDRELAFSFEYTLVRELQDEDQDGYLICEGDFLDLDELCASDVILNLPLKFLCKEDCKGLCSVCGKNLNQSDCDCLNNQIDPRLAGLRNLLG